MKRNYLILGLLSLALAACGGGENGLDGKNGKDGGSCTVTHNGDGSATITCPDGSSFTIKNGENGQSCKLVDNADGSAAVVCPADGSSYIVRGNTDNYKNYCQSGFYGKNCENECNCGGHGDCNDGVTGDGSCSCEKGFYGDNCVDCSADSEYFGTAACTYTDTRVANSEVIYPLVKIGEQLWMAENLKATTDINGNAVTCYANTDRDTNFVEKYGCLYVWQELAELDGDIKAENTNRICPTGWHLPENSEFQTLLDNTGADSNSSSIRTPSWSSGSNSSGFGALAAGYGNNNGNFDNLDSKAFFWSATLSDSNYAYGLSIDSDRAGVSGNNVNYAFSIRCLKD